MSTLTPHRDPAGVPRMREAGGQAHDLVPGVGAPPAPLWRRGVARLVDMGSVFFVLWLLVVMQLLWFMGDASRRLDPQPWGQAFLPLCLFIALSAVYEVVFMRWNAGQTPGKQFFGVRVVRHADGSSLSGRCAFARWALPGIVLVAWPLWAGMALLALTAASVPFGRHRRGLHDRLAGTAVVRYEHVDDELDAADDQPDELEPSGSGAAWTIADVLLGRPSRRALRRRRPFGAVREVDRG